MVFKKFKRGAEDDPAKRSHDPYAALRFRDFRLLIGGRLIAQIGVFGRSAGLLLATAACAMCASFGFGPRS